MEIKLYNPIATTIGILTKIQAGTIVDADFTDLPINKVEKDLFIDQIYVNQSVITADIAALVLTIENRFDTTSETKLCSVGEFKC